MRGDGDHGVTRTTTSRVRRSSIAVGIVVAAGFGTAGCATPIDGSGSAAPGQVAAYQAELSASVASSIRQDGVDLCREAMSSMVVMVRGYNAFVQRLSEVHSYDRVGDLDDRARASLIAGSDVIRGHLSSVTPEDVADPTAQFLDSTGRLGDAIAKRRLTGLNPIAAEWTKDKNLVLDRCAQYLPLPPTSDASPAPAPGSGAPQTVAPPSTAPSAPATP
ncbi:hypothetical protein [Gordonia aquimaris]|uniref:Uncharacterized protein n=1 Tax=Gordonia aquimaris TaxID=2984863 RepID=A0A9X3I5M7_9ACTN|nr:hypothetical protein [Gordonia aquimaris]MCX2965922.1 hypothetical protein [Gordonia aquimaris]